MRETDQKTDKGKDFRAKKQTHTHSRYCDGNWWKMGRYHFHLGGQRKRLDPGGDLCTEIMRKEEGKHVHSVIQAKGTAPAMGLRLEHIWSLQRIRQHPVWNKSKGMAGRSRKGNWV